MKYYINSTLGSSKLSVVAQFDSPNSYLTG